MRTEVLDRMNMSNKKNQIQYVETLLANDDHQTIKLQLQKIEYIYQEVSKAEQLDSSWHQSCELTNGIGISPNEAMRCFQGTSRTAKYIKAIYHQVKLLINQYPERPVELVYAGCGPWGSLITPLLVLFKPQQLQVTFIDIHIPSLNSLKKIIESLGYGSVVSNYVHQDATQYQHTKKIDLIVTETLYNGLHSEGIVSIIRHLAHQLSEKGGIIPKRVVIDAHLIDMKSELALLRNFDFALGQVPTKTQLLENRMFLGNIFELSKDTLDVIDEQRMHVKPSDNLSCKAFHLPNINNEQHFAISTRLYLTDDIVLDEYENGITHPFHMSLSRKYIGKNVSFEYQCVPPVGFIQQE
jgi:hypothetical protein